MSAEMKTDPESDRSPGGAPDIALVLGAGGARGLSHIAVLEAFDELGLKPAHISGCSIGAIVGAAYAAGISGGELREHVLAIFRDRARVIARLLDCRVGKLADLVRGLGNPVLIDGERLLDLFWPEAVPDRFEELAIPFTAIAADYHRHAEVVLADGPLTPAVAASLAIPGLVRPVALGGRVLIDGGAIDPLPYRELLAPGRIVFAVDVSAPTTATSDTRIPGAMEAIVGASQILTRTLVQRMVERQPPDILIRAGADRIGGLDFFKARAILAAAEPIKDEVKRALERALSAAG
ncbi:NTE family protein OS=Bosea thiooxidans OX=53254 GN=SAMN05660750_01770 PE=4 SV=1 [Bosea thiooxidans]|uniref:NTE family protein n=2 Tax=Bosea thiooxidans TaxID=53254 RepID=A0A1T5D6W6_9HYPH|nr:NTE family protein [Bosea thiooxidans]